ncbi:MAG TPA: ABC transporter permease [Vicinamibacterales bacterium]|nr:ABC transporter permease [Vicinamibacterales bacterium]
MSAWSRLRRLWRSEERAAIDRELSFHLEMRARELMDRGMTAAEARIQAQRRFGNYDESRQECVDIDDRRRQHMRRTQYWTEFLQDLAYAFRMYRRSPGFTAVALLTLALGIGANSAIFSVVHGVLLESLPYPNPDQLYRVRTLYPDGTAYSVSPPDFASLRLDTRAFHRIEAYGLASFGMAGMGEPREVTGMRVSDGLFDLLGFRMSDGHGFSPDHFQPGQGNVVVLDHGFWVREFGGDKSAIGRTLTLGGRPYEIAGVLAPDAQPLTPVDLYVPIQYDATYQPTAQPARRSESLALIGRARPGMDAVAVEADLSRMGRSMQEAFPQTNAALTFTATSLRRLMVGDVQRPLVMLMAAVGLVLLVACANVASLLLARASARRQEMAVRAALGAGHARLLRQLVTESVVLAVSGAAAGLLIAMAGTRALVAARPADIPRLDQIGVDMPVVFFTLGVAALTGLLFGLFPAFQATGRSLTASMREGGRGVGAGRGGHRARAILVVAEMALAVMLLMGAGLLIRSFVELTRVPRGFESDRGVTFNVLLQGPAYQTAAQIISRVQELEARLKSLPGVSSAAASTVVPLAVRGGMFDFAVVDAPPPPSNVNPEIAVGSVTPDYFKAVGAPIKLGRALTDQDTAATPRVAVINETGVKRWFGGQDPTGKFVIAGGQREQIVGVVADIRHQRDLSLPSSPQLYEAYAQRPSRTPRFVVRMSQDGTLRESTVRAALHEIDPGVAITAFVPFAKLIDDSVARPRFYTSLLALFAAAALVLAATGIFGVMSYSVAQRSREIGIRMALGARRSRVVGAIVGRAAMLAGAGIVLGIAGTVALARMIQSLLFGVKVLDPLTIAGVAAILGLSAIVASLVPARRAAWIDPGNILREG